MLVQPLVLHTENTAGSLYAFSLSLPETLAGQAKQDPQEGLSEKMGCKRKTVSERALNTFSSGYNRNGYILIQIFSNILLSGHLKSVECKNAYLQKFRKHKNTQAHIPLVARATMSCKFSYFKIKKFKGNKSTEGGASRDYNSQQQ